MRRGLLFFSLFAAFPGLAWAQEPKLVNCRTLEAAGKFVGPDEIIVDDLVCQKAKPGADSATKPQPPKPLRGTTISDTPADNVVDAAKAAGKRIAARKEKEEAEAKQNAAATAAPSPSVAPAESAADTPPVPPTPVKTVDAAAAPPERPQPSPASPDLSKPLAVAREPASRATAPPSTPAMTAEVAIEPASVTAASSPATERKPVSQAEVAAASPGGEPALAPPSKSEAAAPPPQPAGSLPPPDPSHPATSSGFYDANAPKRSLNAAPQTNTGFATAEQVNAGLVPGATSVPPSSQAS